MSGTVLTEQMVLDKTKVPSLGEVRHLNLWGVGLSDVAIVSKLDNIQVLALAANSISSLKCFAGCPTLEELYLRKNNVTNLKEVAALKGLKKLHTLWLMDNPCSKHPLYREFVVYSCGSLKQLDNTEVTEEERTAAGKKMTPKALESILGKGSSAPPAKSVPVSKEAAAAAQPSSSPQGASGSSSPRTGRNSANASTGATSINMIEERSASGKTVLFTTVQAQRAMLTSIVSLLPELTVESLELLEREVHTRVEKQKQQFSRLSQGEGNTK